MKTLPLEQQIALMLAEFYDFKAREIAEILAMTLSVTKHLLHKVRKIMRTIFKGRCALISKDGVCHKCSELAGVFNGEAAAQRDIIKNDLVVAAADPEKHDLLEIRLTLVSAIDPLDTDSASFHHKLMHLNRKAIQAD